MYLTVQNTCYGYEWPVVLTWICIRISEWCVKQTKQEISLLIL